MCSLEVVSVIVLVCDNELRLDQTEKKGNSKTQAVGALTIHSFNIHRCSGLRIHMSTTSGVS